LLGGDFAGQQKPEKAFWERLGAAGSLREDLLAFWNSLATEADTFLRVENGALLCVSFASAISYQGVLHTSHTRALIPRAPP